MPPISRLVDHLGRPVDITSLEGEKATVTVAGVRPVSDFSTLSSLTPSSLAATLRAAAENDIQAYLTLAEEMEERDLHYASVLGTRKLAVEGLDVSVEAAGDEARDVEIAEARRSGSATTISSESEHLHQVVDAGAPHRTARAVLVEKDLGEEAKSRRAAHEVLEGRRR